MAVKILEGVIEEVSNGAVEDGRDYSYEFIKIGGQRVRKVYCDSYLGSFIQVGKKVRLGCVAGMFGGHSVMSLEEEDGTISKVDASKSIGSMIQIFFPVLFFSAALLLCLYIAGGRQLSFLICVALPFVCTYFYIRPYYKARSCLAVCKSET